MDEAVERLAALMESGVEPMELFRTMKSLVRRSVFKNKPWPRDEALEMLKCWNPITSSWNEQSFLLWPW